MTNLESGAPPDVVGPYLASVLDDAAWGTASVTVLAGGRSNLTYRLDSSAGSVVLRRPPLGPILATAHDMGRETRVMSALAPTTVPVPAILHLCTDETLLGRPFYVMEYVDGHVCSTELPPGYAPDPASRRAVAEGLVDVLTQLHAVDPSAVGLDTFGRPDGYLARQITRWQRQWAATPMAGVPGLDTLATNLAASVPPSARSGIVHGDYRLDNTILDRDTPGLIGAVLDWEMSTLGDPIADLGILLAYWTQADDDDVRRRAAIVPGATAAPGFPTRNQVAELYAKGSGADLDALPWALAFAFFKLAVVCAGVVARVDGGGLGDQRADDSVRGCVAPLVELGRATLADAQLY